MSQVNSWKIAAEKLIESKVQPGFVIEKAWLCSQFGLTEPRNIAEYQQRAFEFLTDFERFRNYLLTEHKVALQSVQGVGYRVVPPNEQADFAVQHYGKKIKKQLSSMGRTLTNIDLARLTDAEKASAAVQQGKFVQLSMMVGGSKLLGSGNAKV